MNTTGSDKARLDYYYGKDTPFLEMGESEKDRLVDFFAAHKELYIGSEGREGQVVDLSNIGGNRFTTTLLLKTVGRKSGQERVTPVLYGVVGGEVILVGSYGGADVHPAWYLNLTAAEDVRFQMGGLAFRATWRLLEGTEYDELWPLMVKSFPPYQDYQESTDRQIPLVALQVVEEIERFKS